VEGITGRYAPADSSVAGYELVPYAEVVGWRPQCDCGWQGPLEPRPAGLSDRDAMGAPQVIEDAIFAAWEAHRAPSQATFLVERAAEAHRRAGQELTEAVTAARQAGVSWAEIGRAAGISRQSAHERWAGRVAEAPAEQLAAGGALRLVGEETR